MFLKLNHQKPDLYPVLRKFVSECYAITNSFPHEEKFGLTSQIRRAALSAHLNFSEGASKAPRVERKRFYEVSRGSIIEVDAGLDVACDLKYVKESTTKNLGELITRSFSMLSRLIDD